MILAVETDPIYHVIPGCQYQDLRSLRALSVGGLVLRSVLFDIIVPKSILTIPVSKFLIILITLIQKN